MWDFTNLQSLDLNRNCVVEPPFETESLLETSMCRKCNKKAPDPYEGCHGNFSINGSNDNEKVGLKVSALQWFAIAMILGFFFI
jgi:hypothetical protein